MMVGGEMCQAGVHGGGRDACGLKVSPRREGTKHS